MQAKPDFYGVLGVNKEATAAEIKAAFQKLAAAFHAAGKPKNADDVEEIRKYVTAYRVLSDEEKRRRYEQTGQAYIGDPENRLCPVPDKLDELLQWLEERRRNQAADIGLDLIDSW
jgi:curved DNA-binding protein CbpA